MFYSTLHIYLVIGIYNKVWVILMLVTKRKSVGQSKGKWVSPRNIYTAFNDNGTEQVLSLVVGRAGAGRTVWGARGRVDTEAISRSNKGEWKASHR